jgi:SAM-dependent methyltransferase
MGNWIEKLFVERSDLFLKLLDQRWPKTPQLVDGMIRLLRSYGIFSGNLLDLCCGNGRISIYMAKKGFKSVGVDISKAFLEDGKRKAEDNGVSDRVTFVEGDVRKLRQVLGKVQKPFDVVVSAWTSIGYFSEEDDINTFSQARQLSRSGAILFIAETMQTEYLSIKFSPTSYSEINNIVMLEERKYDQTKARANTSWVFYRKLGKDLEFIDKIDFENHVYSPSELSSLLKRACWETLVFYGNLSTLEPMTPLTHLNLVAKAM